MFCSVLFDLVHSIRSDGGSSYNGGGVDGGNSMESWWMRGPIMCGYTLKRRWNVYKNAYMEYGIMWYFIYMKLIARFHTLFRRHWNALANRGETLHTQSWLLLLLVLAGLGKKSGLFDQPACTTLLHIAFVGVCECLVSMCVHVYVYGLRYISERLAWHGKACGTFWSRRWHQVEKHLSKTKIVGAGDGSSTHIILSFFFDGHSWIRLAQFPTLQPAKPTCSANVTAFWRERSFSFSHTYSFLFRSLMWHFHLFQLLFTWEMRNKRIVFCSNNHARLIEHTEHRHTMRMLVWTTTAAAAAARTATTTNWEIMQKAHSKRKWWSQYMYVRVKVFKWNWNGIDEHNTTNNCYIHK